MWRVSYVGDYRRARIIWRAVKYVCPSNSSRTKASSIGVIFNIKYSAPDVRGVSSEKSLYEVTIDRLPPLKSMIITEWSFHAEVTEVYIAYGRDDVPYTVYRYS
jgi:hypothetical protein